MKQNLEWRKARNGDALADWRYTTYRIDTKGEPMPLGMGRLYFLSVDGKSIGGAGTIEQCKSMAWRHAMNGKL